ncbi:MAG: 23S rRNA (pseudouridine(1915)-N(3))-methyltransferase RlmH [Gammaproteobacteria bacterium]
MRILVIAAGNRQPAWVDEGFNDYARRLRGSCTLELIEVPLGRRSKSSSNKKAQTDEGERMRRAIPPKAHVVALSLAGRSWSTEQLAGRLQYWTTLGAPVCLLVGGPDGLSGECEARAAEQWSISPLTFPHGLVRVLLAEALYRAWSLNEGHPYHRG